MPDKRWTPQPRLPPPPSRHLDQRRWLGREPEAAGPELQPNIERIELHLIDAQPTGPQLYYGLRYHTFIIKPDAIETPHDQVGYWVREPATGTITQTLPIPRGQTALAIVKTKADAKSFSLEAARGSMVIGICSQPFSE